MRILPLPLALALAVTEPEENGLRTRRMHERECTEIEAACAIAQRLAQGGA